MSRASETHETEEAPDGPLFSFLWWGCAAFGLYLLLFIAVIIDETTLKTYWFFNHLPPWAIDALRAIYPFF